MSSTIKDISQLADVSYATVSRALNGIGRMSDETRRKILEIAEQLNYVPNYSARSLVMDKSYNIGVFSIKEKVISSTFYEILEGIQDIVEFKYNLVFKKFENEKELDQILRFKKYDGVIFISIIEEDTKYINLISTKKLPMVVINKKMDDDRFYSVVAEDCEGAYKATEHLIKLAHTDIAYVEGPPENVVSTERRNGYLNALNRYGIPVNDRYIAKSNGSPEGGYFAAVNLLSLSRRPTSIFVYSDPVAIGVIKAILKEGFKIPDDIAVVGFDNMILSQYLVPSLTSIDKPRTEMGRSAARVLLSTLDGEKPDKRITAVETRLIIRESCGALSSDFI